MSLLVGSVFSCSELNKTWLELQLQFLKKNTVGDFDHCVFLNRVSSDLFSDSIIVGESDFEPQTTAEMSQNHGAGLTALLDYFRSKAYDYYLILDSDCFPIAYDWQALLLKAMGGRFSVAAAVRYENLTIFPHPCAFFACGSVIHQPWLDFRPGPISYLGGETTEVGGLLPWEKCLPLVRSNFCNPHPLFAGIYGNLFYHHGCGSRGPHFRAIDYYKSLGLSMQRHHKLLERLLANPSWFIGELLGRKISI